MRPYLRVKGKNLWKLCALVVLGIAVTACYIQIQNISQPATATVGQTMTIQLTDSIQTNMTSSITANYVLGILLPKGWDGATNTAVTYTSPKGNGNMGLMPSSTIEPSTKGNTNLTWAASMEAKFGQGQNLVNDVEWVVFQSNVQYVINNGDEFPADATIKIKVGADNNNTDFFPAYCIAESSDGLGYFPGSNGPIPYFFEESGGCIIATGGSTGILNDYCHPQVGTVTPPKTLSSEFITLNFNNNLVKTGLSSISNVYLCVDSAYTSDGKVLTNFCMQNEQSHLIETSATSGIYSLTFWPQSYFGVTGSTTITRIVYYYTDQTGTIKVGYAGTSVPFSYTFACN